MCAWKFIYISGRTAAIRLAAPRLAWCLSAMLGVSWFLPASAVTYEVNPENYRSLLGKLRPGDTMRLQPGSYYRGLPVHGLHGTADRWIEIVGSGDGETILVARPRHNTISVAGSSFIRIRNLVIDSPGIPVDGVKAEGGKSCIPSHDIEVAELTIRAFRQGQQNVGISTKCAAWNWRIRDNVITGAGTGIYLGESNGSAPFVNGIIENNVIVDPIGYGMQIKHQITWRGQIPRHIENGRTIIRRNLFLKTAHSSSGEYARPNLLLGHVPVSGRGAQSYYDVHSNTLVDNPNEVLFQAEGNVAFYNNRLVNRFESSLPAIAIQPHNDVPRAVSIFYNTIISPGTCVRISAAPGRTNQRIVANALFCDVPVMGGRAWANVSAPFSLAADYVKNPFGKAGALDLSPRGDALTGPKLQIEEDRELDAIGVDFDSTARSGRSRGAYSSAGTTARPILLPADNAVGR